MSPTGVLAGLTRAPQRQSFECAHASFYFLEFIFLPLCVALCICWHCCTMRECLHAVCRVLFSWCLMDCVAQAQELSLESQLFISMRNEVCMYACMHAHVCLYVCMHMYVHAYVCLYAHVCLYACLVCGVSVCMLFRARAWAHILFDCLCVSQNTFWSPKKAAAPLTRSPTRTNSVKAFAAGVTSLDDSFDSNSDMQRPSRHAKGAFEFEPCVLKKGCCFY
jgi:hypothetical protein